MNVDAYYIPDIEDLRVGYVYEQWAEGRPGYPEWLPHCKIEDLEELYNIEQYNHKIRTPYLTKEQIEKEQWSIDDKRTDNNYIWATRWLAELRYDVGECILVVYKYWNPPAAQLPREVVPHFVGRCKSVNEFRTIMKFLDIKKS